MTSDGMSPTYLRMAGSTDRCRTMSHPDGTGENTGECGDTIRMYLKSRRDTVDEATFITDGCRHTRACANAVAELVAGVPVDAAWHIGPDTIAAFLETLPEDHYHCAELAVGALYRALQDLREGKRKPWRRLYDVDRR